MIWRRSVEVIEGDRRRRIEKEMMKEGDEERSSSLVTGG